MSQEWEPLKDGGRIRDSSVSGLDSESHRIGEGKVAFRKKIREVVKEYLPIFIEGRGKTYNQMKRILEAEISREMMETVPKVKVAAHMIGVSYIKFRAMLQVESVFDMRKRVFIKRVPGWEIARQRRQQSTESEPESE